MTDHEGVSKEQKDAALEKFEEAIKELLEANGYDGFLGDWIFLATQGHVRENGSTATSYSTFSNKHQACHTTAGLLHYLTLKNNKYIQE